MAEIGRPATVNRRVAGSSPTYFNSLDFSVSSPSGDTGENTCPRLRRDAIKTTNSIRETAARLSQRAARRKGSLMPVRSNSGARSAILRELKKAPEISVDIAAIPLRLTL